MSRYSQTFFTAIYCYLSVACLTGTHPPLRLPRRPTRCRGGWNPLLRYIYATLTTAESVSGITTRALTFPVAGGRSRCTGPSFSSARDIFLHRRYRRIDKTARSVVQRSVDRSGPGPVLRITFSRLAQPAAACLWLNTADRPTMLLLLLLLLLSSHYKPSRSLFPVPSSVSTSPY